MTELLYLDDPYLQGCSATVIEVIDGNKLVLDRTIFYPRGGGQLCDTGHVFNPHDEGVVVNGSTEPSKILVTDVHKKDGKVLHVVDAEDFGAPGVQLMCVIDWQRRHTMMRMHTASHLVTGIIATKLGAKITGHQLGLDKSRTDFNLETMDRAAIEQCFAEANAYIEQDIPVTTYYMPRDEALKNPALVKLANVLPPAIKELRIVKIGDVDEQADGGTHVKSLKECGRLVLQKIDNKGKNNRRVYFTLDAA